MGHGGPKTDAGKAVSSRNALRHGLLSDSPLAAPYECAADWQAHRQGVLDDLSPRGQLEACLAERAALLLWRLRRVARAEVAAIEVSLEAVEEDYARAKDSDDHPKRLRQQAGLNAAMLSLFSSLPGLADDASLDGEVAADLCQRAMWLAGMDAREVEMPLLPGDEYWEDRPWTARLLRDCLAWSANEADRSPEAFATSLASVLQEGVESSDWELEQAEQALAALRRARVLPPPAELDRFARYEAHLGRELARVMRALHDLQAGGDRVARPGGSDPPSSNGDGDALLDAGAGAGDERALASASAPPVPASMSDCETNSEGTRRFTDQNRVGTSSQRSAARASVARPSGSAGTAAVSVPMENLLDGHEPLSDSARADSALSSPDLAAAAPPRMPLPHCETTPPAAPLSTQDCETNSARQPDPLRNCGTNPAQRLPASLPCPPRAPAIGDDGPGRSVLVLGERGSGGPSHPPTLSKCESAERTRPGQRGLCFRRPGWPRTHWFQRFHPARCAPDN